MFAVGRIHAADDSKKCGKGNKMKMISKVVHTVKDVDKEKWNSILKGPNYSHEWFEYIEKVYIDTYVPYYILFLDNTNIIAILPSFVPKTCSKENIYAAIYWGRLLKYINSLPIFKQKPLIFFSPIRHIHCWFFHCK